jgi:hypothetical protein
MKQSNSFTENKMASQFQAVILGIFSILYFLKNPAFYREQKIQYFVNQHIKRKSLSCYFDFSPVIFSVMPLLPLLLSPDIFRPFSVNKPG